MYIVSSKVTGYQVSETIQVTMRDLTAVGAMLEGLGKLAVQNISGPAFALDDPTAGYDAARADAITKAKTQATLLAEQLGVRLGKIVNFSESSNNVIYPVYAMSAGAAELKGGSCTERSLRREHLQRVGLDHLRDSLTRFNLVLF